MFKMVFASKAIANKARIAQTLIAIDTFFTSLIIMDLSPNQKFPNVQQSCYIKAEPVDINFYIIKLAYKNHLSWCMM